MNEVRHKRLRPKRTARALAPLLLVLWAGCPEPSDTPESPPEPAAQTTGDNTTARQASATEPAVAEPQLPGTVITVETSSGEITIELQDRRAPKTVAHVLAYVQAGFYDNTIVHRSLADGFIQFGAFDAEQKRKPPTRKPLAVEVHNDLRPNAGALLLARSFGAESANHQLMLLASDQPDLHGQYTVLGQTTAGLDVIKKIAEQPTERRGNEPDWPREPTRIERIRSAADDPTQK